MPAIERPTPDRLIEILRQNDQSGDILCGHAADEIERLRAERRWIPVSERLPDEGEQVLVAIRLRHWTHEMPTLIVSSWYEHEDFCGDEDDIPRQGVTHWMPLPEPPAQ